VKNRSNDFDREFDRMRRAGRRRARAFFVIWLLWLTACIGATVWVVINPEAVGQFLGRIVAGFQGAAS